MVAVEAGGLRFQVTEAIKGKLSWRTYFQDSFDPRSAGASSPNSPQGGDRPRRQTRGR